MKKIIVLLSVFTSFNAFALMCNTQEAQVIGKIVDVSRQDQVNCLYKVELSQYNPHVYCPLAEEEIAMEGVLEFVGGNEDCSFVEGEGFSGILVKDADGVISFE